MSNAVGGVPRRQEFDVPVHRGHGLINIVQDGAGVTATFPYLVGTDGPHSTVRDSRSINFSVDNLFLIADIRAALLMTNERDFHFDHLGIRGVKS